MDVTDFLSGGNEDESAALIEALRAQQEEQQRERMGLQDTLRRQQGQAGGLRTLSLLTSMGDNPLLRGLQQASGQQGAQLEGLAGRTEQRLAQTGADMDPLALARLRISATKNQQQGNLQAERLKQAEDRLAFLRDKYRAGAGAAAAAQAKKAEDDLFNRETGLRKEFNDLPEVKAFSGLATSYNNLLSSSKDMSGPGGVATIFNFMKMLDPGVAVMEGDVQLIRNSGGKAAAFANLYDQTLNGNPLPESVRNDLVRQARVIYDGRKRQMDTLSSRYRDISARGGVDAGRVVVPRAPDINLDAPAGTTPAPAASTDKKASAPGSGPKPAKVQYSKSRNRTRELDASGKVIREYEGPPHG